MKNRILIGFIVIILILSGYLGYNYYMNYKSGKFEAIKNQKEIEKVVNIISKEKEENDNLKDSQLKPAEYYPQEKVYDIMHKMANTKIIAEDGKIWGKIPIDEESLKSIKALVSEIDYKDRDYLLYVIDRWENGDFSLADEEHNYFWAKLGGNTGRAIDIKE